MRMVFYYIAKSEGFLWAKHVPTASVLLLLVYFAESGKIEANGYTYLLSVGSFL